MGTKRNLELCCFGDIYLVGLVVGGDVEWTRQHASISHGRALIPFCAGCPRAALSIDICCCDN